MPYPLLKDYFGEIYAVHSRFDPETETLYVGALYVNPGITYDRIRLSGSGATIEANLPAQCINQQNAVCAWDVPLTSCRVTPD